MALQRAMLKKNESYFQEKVEKNANDFKEIWKALKSLGIRSGKLNRPK